MTFKIGIPSFFLLFLPFSWNIPTTKKLTFIITTTSERRRRRRRRRDRRVALHPIFQPRRRRLPETRQPSLVLTGRPHYPQPAQGHLGAVGVDPRRLEPVFRADFAGREHGRRRAPARLQADERHHGDAEEGQAAAGRAGRPAAAAEEHG